MAEGGGAIALAIRIVAETKEAVAGVAEVETKVSGMSKAGAVAGKALAVGLAAVGFAAVKCSQSAEALQANQEKLADSAKKAAGASDEQIKSMNEWAEAQERAKGVSSEALLPTLTKLVNVTHDVGKAQSLASLAMDISARTGKSLDTVTQSLAKAQTGSVAGLAKYQVQTKDAAGHTLTLQQVTAELAKTYSGAASQAADTAAGKQRVLSVETEQLKEKIGTGLLPVEGKFLNILLTIVGAMASHSTTTLVVVGSILAMLAVVKAVSAATAIWSAVTKVAAAGQWLLNAAMDANPVVLIVIGVVALVAALVIAYKRSETFRNIVNAAFSDIRKIVSVVVAFIREHWKALFIVVTGVVGIAVLLIAKHWDTIKAGALAVIAFVRAKWPVIKAVITAPFETAKAVIGRVWDAITNGFTVAKNTLKSTATAVKNAVGGAFDSIASAVQSVVDKIQSVIDKVGALISKVKGAGGLVGKALGAAGLRVSADGGGGGASQNPRVTGSLSSLTVNVRGFVVGTEGQLASDMERMLRRNRVRLGAPV